MAFAQTIRKTPMGLNLANYTRKQMFAYWTASLYETHTRSKTNSKRKTAHTQESKRMTAHKLVKAADRSHARITAGDRSQARGKADDRSHAIQSG